MYDNYNYPMGADTPDAPWNEPVVPEKDFPVVVSQTLSKDAVVTTNDYNPSYDDETGEIEIDTFDTHWTDAYNNQHYTPLELLKLFKTFLEDELPTLVMAKDIRRYKMLINECSNWKEDECEVIY
jgi:hypothetical protein